MSFSVHKVTKSGELHFEGLVHLLRYIRYNTNWDLNYYSDMEYAPLSDVSKQDNIKTENQLTYFSDSRWQDCTYTGRSTVAYIILYQGGPINHGKHVPGTVAQ